MLSTVSQNTVNWWAIIANVVTVGSILYGAAWAIIRKLNRHFDQQQVLSRKFDSHAKKDRKEFRKINRRLDDITANQATAAAARPSTRAPVR